MRYGGFKVNSERRSGDNIENVWCKNKGDCVLCARTIAGSLTDHEAAQRLGSELQVNVLGPLQIICELKSVLAESRAALYIVGSLTRFSPFPYFGGYSISKATLVHVASLVREELRYSGVTVSIVELPATRTPIWAKMSVQLLNCQPAIGRFAIPPRTVRDAIATFEEMSVSPGLIANRLFEAIASNNRKNFVVLGPGARLGLIVSIIAPQAVLRYLVRVTIRRAAKLRKDTHAADATLKQE